ncbi:hypothetical protein ACFX14_033790 [Malus domestica]
MAKVSSWQLSWEVDFDVLLLSTSGAAGPSAATTRPSVSIAESIILVRLHELLSLSDLQVLECQGLDLMGECLNDLAANGQLSTEAITQASSTLDRTQEYSGILKKAFRAEDDLKAATAVRDTFRSQVEIFELQNQRSAITSELAKDFKSSGKSYLTDYTASVKQVEQLKMDKRNQQAEVTMGEVRWLELKAVLEFFLPSSP